MFWHPSWIKRKHKSDFIVPKEENIWSVVQSIISASEKKQCNFTTEPHRSYASKTQTPRVYCAKESSQVLLFHQCGTEIGCGTAPECRSCSDLLNICPAISQEQLCFCVSLSEANCVKSDNVLLQPTDTQPAGCWEALGWINRIDFLNSTSKHTPLLVMELLIVMLSQAVLWGEGSLLAFFFCLALKVWLYFYHKHTPGRTGQKNGLIFGVM